LADAEGIQVMVSHAQIFKHKGKKAQNIFKAFCDPCASVPLCLIKCGALTLFLCVFVFNNIDASNIDSGVNQNLGQENYPVTGTITVTHAKNENIDTSSFNLGDNQIAPTFVKDMPLSNDQVISIYSFTFPGQPPGLYILPGVTVKVGNKVYQSVPSTYEIMGAGSAAQVTPSTQQISTKQGSPTLELEAKVQGPSTLYPGQRSNLFYRILYNRSIDLSESNLPFVHPKEFQKIGDAHIKDYQESVYTVQEISQEIEAINPGTFDFGPSSIAGYTYDADPSGNKIYNPIPLQAVAPVVKLVVHPFPKENQPFSFDGTLGSLKAEVKMISPETINVGEPINLTLTITGLNNPKQMKLPDLSCQPGFSGFFLPNDLPPAPGGKQGVAEFQIKMVPLTDLVKEVPSIEISSFDTASAQYKVQRTKSIPLKVNPSEYLAYTQSAKPKVEVSTPDWNKVWSAPFKPPYPLEMDSHFISTSYKTLSWMETSFALLIIPLGILLLLILQRLHYYLITHPLPTRPRSEILLDKALHDKGLSPMQSITILEQAFWWLIHEKGFLKNMPNELEALPTEGWVGKVRNFILQLQSLQFSRNKQFVLSEVQAQARSLAGEG